MIKEPELIQTTRFWRVGYALSVVNEVYIFNLKKSTDARGAAQLIARREDNGYSLSVIYNPWKKKAPGKLREDIVEIGMSLDDVLDYMSVFERIGQEHDKHEPMPDEHRAANAAIGDAHITIITNHVREARLQDAGRPTQANRLRRLKTPKPYR